MVDQRLSRPKGVIAAGLLFCLAAVTLAVAAANWVRLAGAEQVWLRWFLSGAMLVNAAGFAVLGWGLWRRKRLYSLLAVVFLIGNVVLTLADQVGWVDLLYLLLVLAALVALLLTRDRYRENGL